MEIFDKSTWNEFADGFLFRDCTIGFEDGRIGFLLVQEIGSKDHIEDGWETRLLAVRTALPTGEKCFAINGTGLGFSSISSAWNPNQPEFVVVDGARRTWSYKPRAYKGGESRIPFKGEKTPHSAEDGYGSAITKIVRVGTTVFAVGSPLRIYERINDQKWREHKDIPIPSEISSPDYGIFIRAIGESEFFDLAGYSTEDMYAVGSAGIVWHRKGNHWHQIAFPTNLRLNTVACGDDGFVYITDIRGSVWQGRDQKWQRVVHADNMLAYQDSAWFAGRLWCTNDSAGPFVLEGKKMVPAHQAQIQPMPAQVACFAHRIDVAPDGKTMLVAGVQGAALYNGQHWTVLFDGEPDA
jgi:hypothetical protein